MHRENDLSPSKQRELELLLRRIGEEMRKQPEMSDEEFMAEFEVSDEEYELSIVLPGVGNDEKE